MVSLSWRPARLDRQSIYITGSLKPTDLKDQFGSTAYKSVKQFMSARGWEDTESPEQPQRPLMPRFDRDCDGIFCTRGQTGSASY
jgi:hypothetical protein